MSDKYLNIFKQVLEIEGQAILQAKERIKVEQIHQLLKIFDSLSTTGGQLIFSGVGKSGIVAQKMSSTFCSLGLSSFFLHPTEALHGDLGKVGDADALVILSKSGTTEELLKLFPFISVPIDMVIGLIGEKNSPLTLKCGLVFDCSIEKEACVNNLAPTTSTTLTLAIGDALAVIYESYVGLSKEKFAISHPGGKLGKSLRLRVKDLMIPASSCVLVNEEMTLQELILKMTQTPHGIASVISSKEELLGIIVEGDIRRCLNTYQEKFLHLSVKEVMNKNPVKVESSLLALEALRIMEERKNPISVLPVVANGTFQGILRLHDLLKEGLK